MKSLIKNYINQLTPDKLKLFAQKNDINLTDNEIEYLLNLVKDNYDDMLINDQKYLKLIKSKVNIAEYQKIEKIYINYKNKYKGYLF